jgi:polyisoprenoid-binding protein YceI
MLSRIRIFACAALLLCFGIPATAADTYSLDPAHSTVLFEVSHFGYAQVIGRFNEVSGQLQLDPENLAASSVNVEIKTASVDTGQAKRDEHLRSPDFFNAAEFPTMSFESTSVESTGDKTAKVTGNLTLLGKTAPATLEIVLNKHAPHPVPAMKGVLVAGFSGTMSIDRINFGMKYGEGGIGSDVKIRIEAEALKQ